MSMDFKVIQNGIERNNWSVKLQEHNRRVSDMKALSATMTNYTASFESLINDISSLVDDETAELSEESLKGFMSKMGDMILGVANTFKTIAFKGGKRSEVRYVYESNKVSVGRVESADMDTLSDVAIDYPTGMKTSYLDAVKVIANAHNALNVIEYITTAAKNFDTVFVSMSRNSANHESIVETANKLLESDLKKQEMAIRILQKVFPSGGKPLDKKSFDKLFSSVGDLKACRLELMAMENHILETVKIDRAAKDMSKDVELIVDFITKSSGDTTDGYVPSKKFIQSLATYVRNLAIALSNYSSIINEQMAVEHNLGLAYRSLIDAIN